MFTNLILSSLRIQEGIHSQLPSLLLPRPQLTYLNFFGVPGEKYTRTSNLRQLPASLSLVNSQATSCAVMKRFLLSFHCSARREPGNKARSLLRVESHDTELGVAGGQLPHIGKIVGYLHKPHPPRGI